MNVNSCEGANQGVCLPNFASLMALLICLCCLLPGCKGQKPSGAPASSLPGVSASASNAPQKPVNPADQLQAIGRKVAAAVLVKDSSTLLAYEDADRRAADEPLFKDSTSGLYCYVFDSGCIRASKVRSVYEILSSARQLEIQSSVTKSTANGRTYGLVVFYDKSQIADQKLQSSDFLCSDEALKTVSSWHFTLVDGRWTTSTIFDFETEGLCWDE